MRCIEHSVPLRRQMAFAETGGFAERRHLVVARCCGRVLDIGCGAGRSVRLFSAAPR